MSLKTRPPNVSLRTLAAALAAWIVLVAFPSFSSVRTLLIAPLYIHDADASGDLAYVMAGGDAYLERLQAAADLYHMRKIRSIYILNEQASANFNYKTRRSQNKAESATEYLRFYGVPRHAVFYIEEPASAWMSSLCEAQALSESLPQHAEQIIVVTSAPHTRRSLLCFQRSLPSGVRSTVYAATPPAGSAELYAPIWHEYSKLLIYFLFA